MDRERKIRALRRALDQQGTIKGDEIAFFCPKHDHNPGRTIGQLSANLVTDVFHCWSCNFCGNTLLRLLRLGGDTEYLREYVSDLAVRDGKKIEQPQKIYDELKLPAEFKSLSIPSKSPYYGMVMRYLVGRGITLDDIVRMKMGYCETGEYAGRVIIPSFDEHGALNFFTGRSVYCTGAKYKNGNFSKDIIFNDCMIDWDSPIVVTEGPFDAVKIDANPVPLLGTILNPSMSLFSKIVRTGADVYFAMDKDAYKKQLNIMKTMIEYDVNVYYVNLNGRKDVGEMTKQEFVSAKMSAVKFSSPIDIVRARVMA